MLFESIEAAHTPIAPGARILVRDAEWLVRKVDRTSNHALAITAIGLSELVRDREAIFLTDLDKDITLLRPEDTEFVADTSPGYTDALLYLESRIRQMPPTRDGIDSQLQVGHRAAMDTMPFQLEPALMALDQPRQRILIADTVGLGKTLEAGILLSELIARGRAKRILVVTVRAMMTQFQKEMWSRFTIPLVRLDSQGLARVRAELPTNHNPFHYYDRAIVSIDTLKQDRAYRVYLEQAYWDVIVIDEAHHVAERGTRSQRHRLAQLLASRSDTLIMLSATPHDGKARSFASLMNMLDPTAIADPDNYTPDDIQGLFIRRFKHHVADQLQQAFRPRKLGFAHAIATHPEEAIFNALVDLKTHYQGTTTSGTMLFGTTLEKALFSSPAACLDTVLNRLRRLRPNPDSHQAEINRLETFAQALEAITPAEFSKFQELVSLVRDRLQWNGNDPADRLVIFTERIETLHFLKTHLTPALKLKPEQVAILHGGLSDIEQQAEVENFGNQSAPVRLLIASDVASEGINLHFLSHRMIHFDVPWSLMVFQQRNGRIDRYGQTHDPEIYYLLTQSTNARIQGDVRILELLAQRDDQAARNIGDPSALMGKFDITLEEALTASVMEQQLPGGTDNPTLTDTLLPGLNASELGQALLDLFENPEAAPVQARAQDRITPGLSLFDSETAYVKKALYALQGRGLPLGITERNDILAFDMPPDLLVRYTQFPRELNPHPRKLELTENGQLIKQELTDARSRESAWPALQYLWPLHPAVGWLNERIAALFERPRNTRQDASRHRAPVLRLPRGLASDEIVVVMVGVLPNRKGQPLLQAWLGVSLRPGHAPRVEELPVWLERTGLGQTTIPNDGAPLSGDEAKHYRSLLPAAIQAAKADFGQRRAAFETRMSERVTSHGEALKRLQAKQTARLKLRLEKATMNAEYRQSQLVEGERRIAGVFEQHLEWVKDTLEVGNAVSLQVMALLRAR
jgi:superfamily II DNA or RNA helicase